MVLVCCYGWVRSIAPPCPALLDCLLTCTIRPATSLPSTRCTFCTFARLFLMLLVCVLLPRLLSPSCHGMHSPPIVVYFMRLWFGAMQALDILTYPDSMYYTPFGFISVLYAVRGAVARQRGIFFPVVLMFYAACCNASPHTLARVPLRCTACACCTTMHVQAYSSSLLPAGRRCWVNNSGILTQRLLTHYLAGLPPALPLFSTLFVQGLQTCGMLRVVP